MWWVVVLITLGSACGRVGFDPIADDVVPGAAAQLALGAAHTCAVFGTRVRCWGEGTDGRLGYTTVVDNLGDNETPASAGDLPLDIPIAAVATGEMHTCVLSTAGSVRCWGNAQYGQLGYGNLLDIADAADAGDVPVGGVVVDLVAGQWHTCALLTTGGVRCWGYGSDGRLGYGNAASVGGLQTPADVGDINLGGVAVEIATGEDHTCARLDTGGVRCWGSGATGRLGYANETSIGDNEPPLGDIQIGGAAVQLSLGDDHSCALLVGGGVRCWGSGTNGVLGHGNREPIGDDEHPFEAGDVPLDDPAVEIVAGGVHTCARFSGGRVRCWGVSNAGQLGYSSTMQIGDNETAATAADIQLGGAAIDIAAGFQHTCARLEGGAIRCWGDGTRGRLGYGNEDNIGDNEHPFTAGDVPAR